MNGFYVSMIFFGVLLVIFSLICIFYDKRKAFSFMKSYEDKKQGIVEIINDAEQMLDELNRFSDYIVNQVDLKNEELSKNLKLAEEKVNTLSETARAIYNGTGTTALQKEAECKAPVVEIPILEIPDVEIPATIAVNGGTIGMTVVAPAKKKEKVIPIKNKYSEVIRLSQEGMHDLEIAKRLDMGKGEVELILGLRK